MEENILKGAEAISMFCRLQMNIKRDIPIRPSEMGVLIFTQKQSGSITPIMISDFFKITKPSVTSIINSLSKAGYLEKKPSTIDRRSYYVSATKKGVDLVELAFDEYFKIIELLKNEMSTDEYEMLIQLIQKANFIINERKKQ